MEWQGNNVYGLFRESLDKGYEVAAILAQICNGFFSVYLVQKYGSYQRQTKMIAKKQGFEYSGNHSMGEIAYLIFFFGNRFACEILYFGANISIMC